MPDWVSIFQLTVPVGELVVRGSVTFLALLVLLRIVGQREAGGLSITDILLIVLVAQAAAPGISGDAESVSDTLVIVVSILCWSVLVDAASYRWPAIGRIIKARPRVLIEDGRPNRRALHREFMSADELSSLLRLQGIDDISMVERAQIEPNGMVSIKRHDHLRTEAPERPPALE